MEMANRGKKRDLGLLYHDGREVSLRKGGMQTRRVPETTRMLDKLMRTRKKDVTQPRRYGSRARTPPAAVQRDNTHGLQDCLERAIMHCRCLHVNRRLLRNLLYRVT